MAKHYSDIKHKTMQGNEHFSNGISLMLKKFLLWSHTLYCWQPAEGLQQPFVRVRACECVVGGRGGAAQI